jgi:hypothetical protein
MEQDSWRRLQDLVRCVEGRTFRVDLVNDERLAQAGEDPSEDLRLAALYVLDLLAESDEARAAAIVTRWAESGRPLAARSAAQFLGHSRARERSATLMLLRARLASRLRSVSDAETRTVVDGFTRRPPSPSDPPPVAKMLVVVHGTWASGATWWRWPSPFTQYLDTLTGGSVYKGAGAFSWSGGNGDSDRQAGAAALGAWVQAHPANDLTIVTHSHGGNVAFLATRLGVKAGRVVLLANPMRTDYTPDLRQVDLVYNVYSFGDLVQTPAATFPHERGEGRTLADSERVVNFLAHNGLVGPGHSDLHEPAVWQANGFDQLVT